MSKRKVTRCEGEGQGSCKRCNDMGIWIENGWHYLAISKATKDAIAQSV